MRIPLSAPDVTDADIAAVAAVLRTRHLSLGPTLLEFEGALARYVGCSNAVAVNSGTTALHLCFRVLGIQPGDEVILPSFGFIATANAVRYVGAIPVFVDIDPATLNIAPAAIERAISTRTRAILAVHTFGRPAAMDAIMEIARTRGLRVVEDACEALGAEFRGRKAGSFGDVGVFGFYPNKQITTGEGGALVAHDTQLAARARQLRNQGRSPGSDWLQHAEVGYNYRISDLNCALGLSQLKRIDSILQVREKVAGEYDARLRNIPSLRTPSLEAPEGRISWFVYVVRIAEHFTRSRRDRILEEMRSRGIECGRYFPPIHMQPAFAAEPHRRMDLPVTEAAADRTLALPFFNRIAVAEIDFVCQTLRELLETP